MNEPAESHVLRCGLCGQEVRWALGLRWTPSQGRLVDMHHLIRVDNGLHSSRCPESADVDQMHDIAPRKS